ncbi:MAG: Zn-ribbon domain-containing OB-fold protein [Flavobacteriaceae bacterium]
MGEPVAPIVNDLSRPFWDAAADGRLSLPCCVTTGRIFWPPSPSSPFSAAGSIEWRDVAAQGVLCSSVTYRRAFQQVFAGALPYAVGLIAVAPGVRLQAHLAAPDRLDVPKAGDIVRIGFAPIVEGGPPVPIILG